MEQFSQTLTHQKHQSLFTERSDFIPALPDLTPTYERIINAPINMGKRAQAILDKLSQQSVTISDADFAYKAIYAPLHQAIMHDAISSEELTTYLAKLSTKDSINWLLDLLSERLISHATQIIFNDFLPCKNALETLGYSFEQCEDKGVLSFYDVSNMHVVYHIHGCIDFWRFDINALSADTQTAVVSCLRSFGHLAQIDTLAHCTNEWELYEAFNEVSEKNIAELTKIDLGINEDETYEEIEKIMGEEAFTYLKNAIGDYAPVDEEDEPYKGLLIQRTYEIAQEILFDKLPMFNEKHLYKPHRFTQLSKMLSRVSTKTKSSSERALLKQLNTLVKTVKPFLDTSGLSLEFGEHMSLFGQQFMHFVGFNDMVCIERANNTEMHLMETNEFGEQRIKTNQPEDIKTFTNVLIGYHLMSAVETFLGEDE